MKEVIKSKQFIVFLSIVLISIIVFLAYVNNNGKMEEREQGKSRIYESSYEENSQFMVNNDIQNFAREGKEKAETTEFSSKVSPASYMVQARLNREQMHAKKKETLLEIINNESASESEKKDATKSMTKLQEACNTENTIEVLLKEKGLANVLVIIDEKQIEVIIDDEKINDTIKEQIKSIIKNQMGTEIDKIVITPIGGE